MKKILTIFAAAVAALTLASCNKDDSVYENASKLDATIGIESIQDASALATKSDATTTTTEDIESFKMWIYRTDATTAVNAGKLTWTGNNTDGWSNGADAPYYWQKGKTYRFLAAAKDNKAWDATGWTLSPNKDSFLQCSNYAVANGKATTTNQEDIVFAFAEGTQDSQVTSLTFFHALSRIRVAGTYDKGNTTLNAKILGYKFTGVGVEGGLTGPQAADADITWNTTKTGVVYDWDRYTKDNAPEMDKYAENAWCNVIPGEKVATGLVVEVAFYDGTEFIGTRELHAKVGGTVAALTNDVKKYQSGIQYTYNIKVVKDGGDDTDPDDPDPDNPTPDDPLSKYKIEILKVTVTPWKSVTGGSTTYGK